MPHSQAAVDRDHGPGAVGGVLARDEPHGLGDLVRLRHPPQRDRGQAALLLVVFNESQQVLEKDLELFEQVLMQKEVLAGFRHVRSVPILDRVGHRVCSVALWPTLQR